MIRRMSERPDEPSGTPDWLAKPVSPSGEQPPYDPNPYGAPTPPPDGPSGPPAWTPYSPPAGGYPGGVPAYPFGQPHKGANTAMGLGVASLVCAVTMPFVCITMPGVLCGPFAIALGLKAQREIRASPGVYNNPGAATTGFVTGIIGTVAGVAMIGLVVLFFGFVFSVGP